MRDSRTPYVMFIIMYLGVLGIQVLVTLSDLRWIAKKENSPELLKGRRRLSNHLDWREAPSANP